MSIAAVLLPGTWLIWPRRNEPSCRTDLGVALLTGALVAFTVLAVQIVFELRFADLDEKRQQAQDVRDELLSMKLAVSSQDNLTGAQLARLDLRGFYLARKTLVQADMQETILVKAVLAETDLTDANLSRADLRSAVLTRADLAGAVLKGATLTDADLSEANLHGADFRGAKVTLSDLSGARYDRRTRWPSALDVPPCEPGEVCEFK